MNVSNVFKFVFTCCCVFAPGLVFLEETMYRWQQQGKPVTTPSEVMEYTWEYVSACSYTLGVWLAKVFSPFYYLNNEYIKPYVFASGRLLVSAVPKTLPFWNFVQGFVSNPIYTVSALVVVLCYVWYIWENKMESINNFDRMVRNFLRDQGVFTDAARRNYRGNTTEAIVDTQGAVRIDRAADDVKNNLFIYLIMVMFVILLCFSEVYSTKNGTMSRNMSTLVM